MLYAVHNITKIEKNHMYISSIYIHGYISRNISLQRHKISIMKFFDNVTFST